MNINPSQPGLPPERTHVPVRQKPASSLTVARYFAGLGQPVVALAGIRRRLLSTGVELTCTCTERAGDPCRRNAPGDHARSPGWRMTATAEPVALEATAQAFPDANFGVVTGGSLGLVALFVVDGDGEDTLNGLERTHGRLPTTVVSADDIGVTYWFRSHSQTLHNRPIGGGVKLAAGMKGYISLPGGLQISGQRRVWVTSPDEIDIAFMPPAWVRALADQSAGTSKPNARLFPHPSTQTENQNVRH
jgi:hypothetical protein